MSLSTLEQQHSFHFRTKLAESSQPPHSTLRPRTINNLKELIDQLATDVHNLLQRRQNWCPLVSSISTSHQTTCTSSYPYSASDDLSNNSPTWAVDHGGCRQLSHSRTLDKYHLRTWPDCLWIGKLPISFTKIECIEKVWFTVKFCKNQETKALITQLCSYESKSMIHG